MNMVLTAILGLVMTWTVESRSAVSCSGDVPESIVAEYTNTYNKGTVRKGDTACLVLSSLHGLTVEKIEYSLHSNKDAGAGAIIVAADNQVLASKSGTYKSWCGAYDADNNHMVKVWSGSRAVASDLSMQLIGTTNSLYLEKIVITYQPAPTYSVELMMGSEFYKTLTETSGGVGVELPAVADRDNWHFLGWTTQEFWCVSALPATWYKAGTRIYPAENIRLWSLWQSHEEQKIEYVSDLQSGDYIYMNRTGFFAVSGTPVDGRLACTIADAEAAQQVYHIEFDEAKESATIQHKATGKYIGYSGTKIVEKKSAWQVWHAGDSTVFYATVNTKTYVLWPDIYETDSYHAGLYKTNNVTAATTVLFSTQYEQPDPVYTCHPESGLGIDFVEQDNEETQGEWVLRFGNYEMIIRNGKKYIRLW